MAQLVKKIGELGLHNRQVTHLIATRAAAASYSTQSEKSSYKCVILGGGSGGCAMAAKMTRKFGKGNVAVVEPHDIHYYQAMFTLVGSGHKSLTQAARPMGKSLPRDAKWIKDSVASVEPDSNTVVTSSGLKLEYDMLIVAVGVQLNFDKISGSLEALESDPRVCSNFSANYVNKTHKAFQAFPKGGTAIFTMPPLPIKCPGAPQKIMYLFDDYLRKNGLREGSRVLYNTNLPVIFGVKKYADALLEVVKQRDITVNFQHNLIGVDHTKGEATFAKVGADPVENVTMNYDLLHISPSMSAPEFLKGSPIANEAGFVDVSKEHLQHTKYDNIFAIGDCSSAPTSKTAAAVAAESGILSGTIEAFLKGQKPSGLQYDGYTSCPLTTKGGKIILAEFDYNGQPLETFPVNQGKERLSMWYLKKDAMPIIYWQMLIKGRWHGPRVFRKLFRFGMGK
ncbi:sulfide:quinone oxidoreductase, mitochondrial-like [Watersipora subatra]|uniref:sulfide:quinone oxidoreductase, mitochondrial-like n=1 Tax=Watersipora subatra TaxID=2589382 RepID=UPI00355C0671